MNAEESIDQLLQVLASKNVLRDSGKDPLDRPVRKTDADKGVGVIAPVDDGWIADPVPDGLLNGSLRSVPDGKLDDRDENGFVDECDWPIADYDLPEEFDEAWDTDDGYFPDVGRQLDDFSGIRGNSGIADAYAWYCPYHSFTDGYGIYIREAGLRAVATGLARLVPSYLRKHISRNGQKRQAYVLLHRAAFYYFCLHEFYHHKTESFATRLELLSNSPVHIPYMKSVYAPAAVPKPTDNLVEEGLAVGEVYRCLKHVSPFKSDRFWGSLGRFFSVKEVLTEFVKWELGPFTNLPPGYRLAAGYLGSQGAFNKAAFQSDQFKLMSMVNETMQYPMRANEEWQYCADIFAGIFQPELQKDVPKSCSVTIVSKQGTPIGALPKAAISASKAMRLSRQWRIRRSARIGKGDHVWLENHLGHEDHIDTGRTDLTGEDWKAILGLVSSGWSIDLKNNENGRNAFLAGPKRCRAAPL